MLDVVQFLTARSIDKIQAGFPNMWYEPGTDCTRLQTVQVCTPHVNFTASRVETLSFYKWPPEKKHIVK